MAIRRRDEISAICEDRALSSRNRRSLEGYNADTFKKRLQGFGALEAHVQAGAALQERLPPRHMSLKVPSSAHQVSSPHQVETDQECAPDPCAGSLVPAAEANSVEERSAAAEQPSAEGSLLSRQIDSSPSSITSDEAQSPSTPPNKEATEQQPQAGHNPEMPVSSSAAATAEESEIPVPGTLSDALLTWQISSPNETVALELPMAGIATETPRRVEGGTDGTKAELPASTEAAVHAATSSSSSAAVPVKVNSMSASVRYPRRACLLRKKPIPQPPPRPMKETTKDAEALSERLTQRIAALSRYLPDASPPEEESSPPAAPKQRSPTNRFADKQAAHDRLSGIDGRTMRSNGLSGTQSRQSSLYPGYAMPSRGNWK